MAILKKDELLAKLRERIGDDTSDDTIAFIEDVSDTVSDLETKASDTTNWQQKYNDNDAEWRKKYRDRFFSGDSNEESGNEHRKDEEDNNLTFENLFKEG